MVSSRIAVIARCGLAAVLVAAAGPALAAIDLCLARGESGTVGPALAYFAGSEADPVLVLRVPEAYFRSPSREESLPRSMWGSRARRDMLRYLEQRFPERYPKNRYVYRFAGFETRVATCDGEGWVIFSQPLGQLTRQPSSDAAPRRQTDPDKLYSDVSEASPEDMVRSPLRKLDQSR